MKPVKILVDNKIPFIKGALDDVADVRYLDGCDINSSNAVDADALIIRTRTICNKDLLEGSSVKCIATATIGYDHIDTEYCDRKGIYWTNAPGCNSSSVEQYFISCLLELSERKKLSLGGMTLGVIGIGNVGSKVVRAASALGIRVLKNDPPLADLSPGKNDFVSLDKIRKEADIITFHVPLTSGGKYRTLHMADGNFFNSLEKKVHLVNSSRGPVVDEKALISALRSGKVASCTLDVWENEPAINPEMLELAEFATPHIAGYSTDGKVNGTAMSVQAVSRFFGLGRDNWEPANIPAPENSLIEVDCNGKDEEEIIRTVYAATYSISYDDKNLRSDPTRFEALRGSYRTRREPKAFTVNLFNNKFAGLKNTLINLGFNLATGNHFNTIKNHHNEKIS